MVFSISLTESGSLLTRSRVHSCSSRFLTKGLSLSCLTQALTVDLILPSTTYSKFSHPRANRMPAAFGPLSYLVSHFIPWLVSVSTTVSGLCFVFHSTFLFGLPLRLLFDPLLRLVVSSVLSVLYRYPNCLTMCQLLSYRLSVPLSAFCRPILVSWRSRSISLYLSAPRAS